MDRESIRGRPGIFGLHRTTLVALLVLVTLTLLAASCGGATPGGGEAESPEDIVASEEETSSEQASAPAEATVGPDENSNMLPAGGKAKDSTQTPPQDPPDGVQTYPASSNNTVETSVTYEQDPPTNGDHASYWQNCGFYSEPVENEAAVHSMDHGAVWITYQPDLPEDQVNVLRDLAQQDYVLVSPYPDLNSPVIANAWRNQLELTGPDDPRLQQFVDQFRLTDTAPLSGNGCTDGRGEPEV